MAEEVTAPGDLSCQSFTLSVTTNCVPLKTKFLKFALYSLLMILILNCFGPGLARHKVNFCR